MLAATYTSVSMIFLSNTQQAKMGSRTLLTRDMRDGDSQHKHNSLVDATRGASALRGPQKINEMIDYFGNS